MDGGELALGKNVTVAFMTWDGYNYEDAVSYTHLLFDVIITNPPIRAGMATVEAIFAQGYERLAPGGYLWAVMRKRQGAKRMMEKAAALSGFLETVLVKKGYCVFYIKKPLTF